MKQKQKQKQSRKVPVEPAPDEAKQPGSEAGTEAADAEETANPTPDGAGAEPAASNGGEADETEKLRDRLLRLQADFDNYRKRVQREKNELYRRANEDIMIELLPALDHLEMALDAAATHDAPAAFTEGFRLVAEQLLAALGKFGLTPIDAEGQPFDVNLHEAVSHLPSADVPEEHVMNQVRRGYRLGDFLLRPAQVVVSSGPPAANGDAAAASEPSEG